jgi:hypothetical protein
MRKSNIITIVALSLLLLYVLYLLYYNINSKRTYILLFGAVIISLVIIYIVIYNPSYSNFYHPIKV